MFTMKKFAILATVGFIAFTTISCSDDKDDSDPQPTPLGEGWTNKGSAKLGGASNADLGSFLDVDAIKVYKSSEAAAAKNEIDLVFDGSNFLTPEGCVATSNALCGEKLAGFDEETAAILIDVSAINDITATSTPNDIQAYNLVHQAELEAKVVTAVQAKAGGKFLMFTTKDNLALVVVNSDLSTTSVTLSLGTIPLPE